MTRPTHRRGGLYATLERSSVYEHLQNLVGGRAARRRIVDEFIQPFPGAKLLDVGCGTGVLLDHLPETVDYTGFDFNPAYIETARRQRGGRGSFYCAHVGSELAGAEEGTFDIVVAVALLHHLEDAEVHELLAAAKNLLKRGGVFVSIDGTVHPKQSVLARAMLALDRGGRIRTPEAYRALIEPYFERIERSLVKDLLPIPYSHFIVRAVR